MKKARETGIVAVEVNGEAKPFWKDSGNPVGPKQLISWMKRWYKECAFQSVGPDLEEGLDHKRVPTSFTATDTWAAIVVG